MNLTSLLIIEIVWTISAIAGLGLSLYNLHDVTADRRTLRRSKLNGLRTLSINGAVRGERVRLYIHVVFVMIGTLVLLVPNEPQERASAISWGIRAMLLSANWALTYNTFADNHLRRKIFGYASNLEDKLVEAEKVAAAQGKQDVLDMLTDIKDTQASVAADLVDRDHRADDVLQQGGEPGAASDAASTSQPARER